MAKKGILHAIKEDKRKEMARQLKGVLNFVDTYFFIEGLSDSDYKKIKKEVNEIINDIKKGKHLKKIFNEENIRELSTVSPDFVEEFLDEDYEDYL